MQITETLAEQHFDVVIIGAGVAGAMSGLLCARAGMRTLLIDRQQFPRPKVCGCSVNGRALKILKQAGLEPGLRGLGPTFTSGLAIHYRRRKLLVPMPTNVAISRKAMDQWLVDEAVAAGCHFLDDVKAVVVPTEHERQASEANSSVVPAPQPVGEREIELLQTGSLKREVSDASDLNRDAAAPRVFARIVLVCDGLGHPSLHRFPAFRAVPEPGSRIGLGAVFPRRSVDDWIKPGEILMVVSKHGYAGVVEIENQQWNLAAAIDPSHLNVTRSPLASLESLFQAAGVPMLDELSNATIRGTVPLTRKAERIAGERIFLLGDSTGYVEPFTGEGMAWALTAAATIVPMVQQAVCAGWSPDMLKLWPTMFRRIVGREQKICRLLSAALKRPWMLPPILTTCQIFPSLTRRLVSQINRVPEALEIS